MTARVEKAGKTYTVRGHGNKLILNGIPTETQAKEIASAYDQGYYTGGRIQAHTMKEKAEELLEKLRNEL